MSSLFSVKGTNHRGEAVEFPTFFCFCPMLQDDCCAHWWVDHLDSCGFKGKHNEQVKGCSVSYDMRRRFCRVRLNTS